MIDDEDLTENNRLPVEVAGETDIFFEEEEEKEAEVQPPNRDEANPKWKKFSLVRNNENIRTKEEDNIYPSNRLQESSKWDTMEYFSISF